VLMELAVHAARAHRQCFKLVFVIRHHFLPHGHFGTHQ
jgi:hypothetical protein